MKALVVSAFFVLLPCLALAQQSSSAPCGISHWSTTGAACGYAPDLPGAKMRVIRSSDEMRIPFDTASTFFGKHLRVLPEYQVTPGQRDTSIQKRKSLRRKRLQKPLPAPGGVVKPPVPNPDKMPIVPGDSLSKAQPK
ncbi:MAG TPA: hypothetical protein VG537_03245 [Candidatus Kapabacteria bacterium]|jgi:hypothetical protein|nr:hypothetical protein [Candidatus Kapabacteria bacterium]